MENNESETREQNPVDKLMNSLANRLGYEERIARLEAAMAIVIKALEDSGQAKQMWATDVEKALKGEE